MVEDPLYISIQEWEEKSEVILQSFPLLKGEQNVESACLTALQGNQVLLESQNYINIQCTEEVCACFIFCVFPKHICIMIIKQHMNRGRQIEDRDMERKSHL